jgi:hypothetical protein
MFGVHGMPSKALASSRKPEKAHVTVLYIGQFQIMSIMFFTFRLDGRITVLLLDRIKSNTAWCDQGEFFSNIPLGVTFFQTWRLLENFPAATAPPSGMSHARRATRSSPRGLAASAERSSGQGPRARGFSSNCGADHFVPLHN